MITRGKVLPANDMLALLTRGRAEMATRPRMMAPRSALGSVPAVLQRTAQLFTF